MVRFKRQAPGPIKGRRGHCAAATGQPLVKREVVQSGAGACPHAGSRCQQVWQHDGSILGARRL
eukprot:13999353-Alexandrium_andersonii.AAC.1